MLLMKNAQGLKILNFQALLSGCSQFVWGLVKAIFLQRTYYYMYYQEVYTYVFVPFSDRKKKKNPHKCMSLN